MKRKNKIFKKWYFWVGSYLLLGVIFSFFYQDVEHITDNGVLNYLIKIVIFPVYIFELIINFDKYEFVGGIIKRKFVGV